MKKNQRERSKERERVKGRTVCEAWAWVQTGRVSEHSSWVERSERMGTLWNTAKKDGIKDIQETREEERQDLRPGWAGSVRTLKNLWPGASTYEQEVLYPGPTEAVRFTQRRTAGK